MCCADGVERMGPRARRRVWAVCVHGGVLACMVVCWCVRGVLVYVHVGACMRVSWFWSGDVVGASRRVVTVARLVLTPQAAIAETFTFPPRARFDVQRARMKLQIASCFTGYMSAAADTASLTTVPPVAHAALAVTSGCARASIVDDAVFCPWGPFFSRPLQRTDVGLDDAFVDAGDGSAAVGRSGSSGDVTGGSDLGSGSGGGGVSPGATYDSGIPELASLCPSGGCDWSDLYGHGVAPEPLVGGDINDTLCSVWAYALCEHRCSCRDAHANGGLGGGGGDGTGGAHGSHGGSSAGVHATGVGGGVAKDAVGSGSATASGTDASAVSGSTPSSGLREALKGMPASVNGGCQSARRWVPVTRRLVVCLASS